VTMELDDALRQTGSVRSFTDAPVDDATVHRILDTARFAPSGGNRQPWRVVVVHDPALRRALGDAMQPVWDEYVAASQAGQRPFNAISYSPPASVDHAPNVLLDGIVDIPVVLVIAADLREIALMDGELERPPIAGGASIHPFCWSILLAAHGHGLGGVMTTFLARAEPVAAPLLGLPPHHALAATIFLGVPTWRATKLRRNEVSSFATVDRFDGSPLQLPDHA
jgi:nitroreductase